MELRHAGAALILLGVLSTPALAADEGRPVSSPTLSAMGLGNMQALDDAEGATVRGKFTFAFVHGFSRVGPVTRPYVDGGANHASGFKAVILPSGGGFGVAFGGARAWAN